MRANRSAPKAVAWSGTEGQPFAACDRNPNAEPFTTRITSLLALVPTAVMIQRKLASAAGLGVIRICSSVSSVGEREQCRIVKNNRLCSTYARPQFVLSLREDQGCGTTQTLRSFVKTYPEDWRTRDDFNGGTSYNNNFFRHPENDAERDAFLAESPSAGIDQPRADAIGALADDTLRQAWADVHTQLLAELRSGRVRDAAGGDALKAMTGAFDLLRETVTLAAPAAVHGDELIRTLLLGTEQLPAEDGAAGPVTAAISATVAEPQRGDIVSTVFNTGEAHAAVLQDHVLGYLASPESARTERSWLLVSVQARLTAGDAA